MKQYKLGMVCGRFSHIHKGHELIINKSIELCEKTLILVGSSQESHTLRNPFTSQYRIKLIKKIYNKPTIEIKELEDMTNEFDINTTWGQYVIDKTIDLIISGNDEMRTKWFSKEQLRGVKELLIDRNTFNISATELRGYILINDKQEWEKYVPKEITEEFEEIREKLLEVPIYKKILQEMPKKYSIENYLKIYKKYEEEDKMILA